MRPALRLVAVLMVLAVASAGLAAISPPQEAPPPVPEKPKAPAAPPLREVTPEELARSREARLARERAALESELARIESFGRVEEFRDALRELGKRCDEFPPGTERWVEVAGGWLPMMAVDHWLLWHLPAEGRELPVAVDFEQPHHPFAAIVDLSVQLHAHDVELLMVVFPSRVQLEPELVLPQLGELAPDRFRGMVGATTRFLLALNGRGVETVNLAPPFVEARKVKRDDGVNGDLYLARNKHWTPRAAELAARAVAERVREMPWFVPGVAQEGVDFELVPKTLPFTSTAGGQAPDRTPEKVEFRQIRQTGPDVNRFDERRSPIVVLSDSFAKFYSEEGQSSSFVDHLRRFTGWPIDAITPMGGGELQCRQALAQRGDKLRGKKVVIWLMQEDNLRPIRGFRPVDVFAGR